MRDIHNVQFISSLVMSVLNALSQSKLLFKAAFCEIMVIYIYILQ